MSSILDLSALSGTTLVRVMTTSITHGNKKTARECYVLLRGMMESKRQQLRLKQRAAALAAATTDYQRESARVALINLLGEDY